MRTFEGQGIIRRRQGVGTFVVGPIQVIETGLEVLESIETLAEKIGLDVKMGELEIQQINANEYYATNLQVDLDTPLLKISRVINTDNRPVAFLVDVIPESIFSHEDLEAGFTGSVLDRLIESEKIDLSISQTVIQAEAASSSIARALQIQRGDVLLFFKAHLFSTEGKIIDYSYSYFLPGYFSFQVVRRVGDII
jgi:GntR family transcriptional regulator